MTPKSWAYALLLGAVVALGAATVWGFVVAWGVSMVEQWSLPGVPFEQIAVRLTNGEPVIERSPASGDPWAQTRYSTLDGKSLPSDELLRTQVQYTSPPDERWQRQARLAAINDGRTPATYWYLVHDGQPNGLAYGVGYHSTTKQLAGYFGRSGFTSELPPPEDWFTVPGNTELSLATVMSLDREPNYATEHTLPLLADGRLWLIDTERHTVHSLMPAPQAYTVINSWHMAGKSKLDSTDLPLLSLRLLLVRSPEKLTMFDPATKAQMSVAIPPELRRASLACIGLDDGGALLIAGPTDFRNPRHFDLIWFDAAGQVSRKRSVELAGQLNTGEAGPWLIALLMPLPLASGIYAQFEASNLLAANDQLTWAAAMKSVVAKSWPALACVAALSLGLAVLAYRRQRSYVLPHAALWGVLVFLLGPAGYLAYRYHRIWPVREACPRCGKLSPRDRECCCQCEAAFPPPALTGVEVFA